MTFAFDSHDRISKGRFEFNPNSDILIGQAVVSEYVFENA
jgi:hypothetical protein